MARKAPAPPKTQHPKPTKSYSVTLNTAGHISRAEGETIAQALAGLNPKIMKIRGKLTVTSGKLKSEIMLMPIQMRRLAVNSMTREIVGKRLATLLR